MFTLKRNMQREYRAQRFAGTGKVRWIRIDSGGILSYKNFLAHLQLPHMPGFGMAKGRNAVKAQCRSKTVISAGFGRVLRSFSFNRPTIHLKRSKNLMQTDTTS